MTHVIRSEAPQIKKNQEIQSPTNQTSKDETGGKKINLTKKNNLKNEGENQNKNKLEGIKKI